MDVNAILKELRQEREQLEEAILALERMMASSGKRRGRPPAWLQAMKASESGPAAPKRRGRPPKNPGAPKR